MLEVSGLSVRVRKDSGVVWLVRSVSFRLERGEVTALVGESGCGKTMMALALMGLLPPGAEGAGRIRLLGKSMPVGQDRAMAPLRGRVMAMVFQDPFASLNPVMKVGLQVAEVLAWHKKKGRREAFVETCRLFAALGLIPPEDRFHHYPHQLSGGQRQRVMMAAALACNPPLLIADEPTTALDPTFQVQVLDMLAATTRGKGNSLLLITHDLGAAARTADRVLVMLGGLIVEEGTVEEVLTKPAHPYTRLLLDSVPRLDRPLCGSPESVGGRRKASGCPFAAQCHAADRQCHRRLPPVIKFTPRRSVRCHMAWGRHA